MKYLSRTLTAAALAAAPALFAAGPAVITVDASKVVAPVNELGFGNNIEAADGRGIFSEPADAKTFNVNGVKYGQGFWDPDKNAPNPVTTGLAKTLRMGMMRYPGGCLAHNYNWTHAVGPLSERSDWKFGIDQFMELCRKMNWEPLFTLTDYALPAEELPQHLANLVEYLNAPATPEHPWAMKRAEWGHKEPYGVKYFELGNETDHGSHKTNPRRSYTPEQYIKYATDSIKAIRKVDPTVKLGLVTVPGNGTDWNCDWNRKVIAGAGDDLAVPVAVPVGAVAGHGDEPELHGRIDLADRLDGIGRILDVLFRRVGAARIGLMAAVIGLVAELEVLDAVRLLMTPLGTLHRPRMFGRGRSVQVFDEVREVLRQLLGRERVVGQREERFPVHLSAELHKLVDAEFPVGAFGERPDGVRPVVVVRETAARITHHAHSERLRQAGRDRIRRVFVRVPEALPVFDAVHIEGFGISRLAEDAAAVRRLDIVAEAELVDRSHHL